jgi:sarcosine/dimethylglycine N-methyltransferase
MMSLLPPGDRALSDPHREMVSLTSQEFVNKTLKSIEPWIEYYEQGYMQWGLLHYGLPNEASRV